MHDSVTPSFTQAIPFNPSGFTITVEQVMTRLVRFRRIQRVDASRITTAEAHLHDAANFFSDSVILQRFIRVKEEKEFP